jgi:hypothetical protein
MNMHSCTYQGRDWQSLLSFVKRRERIPQLSYAKTFSRPKSLRKRIEMFYTATEKEMALSDSLRATLHRCLRSG